jgi:aspartyl-tRNA synthetase
MLRTHTCGELRLTHAGQDVTLTGWVQKARDLGPFIFIDVRDRYGITQINVNKSQEDLFETAKKLGREFVVQVTGKVVERESKNALLPSGEIEIMPTVLTILSASDVPPFKIEDDTDGNEDVRMKYRYLDLRRPVMVQRLLTRAKMMRAVREFLDAKDFCEIETPVLIKSTPEGARDFLVPSRLQPGSFYALPQSPQILKQLLMVGGMDRYYQIVKCFRDEDFRGDRQPEFTQIDCEMAFVTQEDIFETFGGMTQHVFKAVANVDLPTLRRIPYQECIEKYGSDKPDLRFGCEIHELNSLFTGTEFPVFANVLSTNGLVAGINATGCAKYSRKQIDELTEFVKAPHRGAGGLIWIRYNEDGTLKSSADKFFDENKLKEVAAAFAAKPGDLLLLIGDKKSKTRKILGDLRLEIANREGWRKPGEWSVFWVVDFPLFEKDEETGALNFAHHPFCMPNQEDWHQIDTHPENCRAFTYDMVMNGNEILSGSVRIHRPDIQQKIFGLLGLNEAQQQEKFGFLLEAFRYGAPPHAGCAFGFDRWVALMTGCDNIRDVMAYPKTSGGRDLMMESPGPVPEDALKDLGIKILE